MLTAHQQQEFEQNGIVKVAALLPAQAVSHARMAILSKFEALGLSHNGKWYLETKSRANWPDKGYSAKTVGNKIAAVEQLLDAPGIAPIVDQLLTNAARDKEMFKRPQVLVTLPNEGVWFMPHDGWHVDFARVPSGKSPGVQIFMLLDEVKPQGGGTLVIAGSHQLLNGDGFIRASDVTRRLREQAVFQHLTLGPQTLAGIDSSSGELAANPQQSGMFVIELTGVAGDVYFMDMRAVHSAAPNVRDNPRMMATHRFLRADIVAEMALST